MNDERAFTLPPIAAIWAVLWFLAIAIVGLSLSTFLGFGNGLSSGTGFFCILLAVGGYFYLVRHKWVFLSPTHIRGESMSGKQVNVAWADSVTVRRRFLNGLSGFELRAEGPLRTLFIPKAIAQSEHFMTVAARYAPKTHALLIARAL
jgi:hypothetical protein